MSKTTAEVLNKEVDRSRAYGLMRGAVEGILLRLPEAERERVMKLAQEADALWDGSENSRKD